MKRLSKKWIIILSILLAVAITLTFILYNKFRGVERSYIAYVDINPLIKLNFNTTCKQNVCNEPIITDYELINEDAKTIYKDLVLNDKTLKETIELLANTVTENEIAFKEVHIYTNYDKEDDFKLEGIDYNINLDIKKDNELETFIDELIVKKENVKTKEVLVPVVSVLPIEQRFEKGVKSIIPLEHEEKFTTLSQTLPFVENYEPIRGGCLKFADGEIVCDLDIGVDATFGVEHVKITILGDSKLIDTIPDVIPDFYEYELKANVDITNLDIGTHESTLEFVTNIPELDILTPPIKVQIEIISGTKDNIIEKTEEGLKDKYNKDFFDRLGITR